jgi:hypothetical protein
MTNEDAAKLRCCLQHWYELRPKGTTIGVENNRRLVGIKALHMVWRRQGEAALRGMVLDTARGMRIIEPACLLVGAGLFPEDLRVETLIRRSLDHAVESVRIAATYGAVFFLKHSEEMSCTLAERVMMDKGVSQASSADAIALAQHVPCARCKKITTEEGWCPVRSS